MPPIDHLWRSIRDLFASAQRAIGDTATLASRIWLDRAEVRDIRDWIAPIEIMLRHLLVIEALRLPAPKACAPTAAHKQLTVIRATTERAPNFRIWPKPPKHPGRVRQLGPPVLVRDIWRENARAAAAQRMLAARAAYCPIQKRLARRIEALARALEAPERLITRLARKLRLIPKLAQRIILRRIPRAARNNEALSEAARISWIEVRNAPDSS